MKYNLEQLINHVNLSVENSNNNISKLTSEILSMYGMSGNKTRHLYNNICSLNGANYLEICSINIINECVKHDCKLIFTSSMAVYGNQKSPFTEDMLPIPVDPYGIAKYAVEMDIKLANEQFGLKYNIVRPHNVLGLYQNIWDKYRNVIGIFIRKVLNNESILIYNKK